MSDASRTLIGPGPTVILAPDGTVHVRVHATTLHLDASEFLALVRKSLGVLAEVERVTRGPRNDGELQ